MCIFVLAIAVQNGYSIMSQGVAASRRFSEVFAMSLRQAQGRSSDSTRRVGVLAHHLPSISAQRWAGTPTLLSSSSGQPCPRGEQKSMSPIYVACGDIWGYSGTFGDIWGQAKWHDVAARPSWRSKNALGTCPWVQMSPHRGGVGDIWGHLEKSQADRRQETVDRSPLGGEAHGQ
jgi:hypothetical protein